MAIKRKDGSEYKISGPNPLLIGQERWDTDPVFRIHNFDKYKPEVYEIESSVVEVAKEEVAIIESPLPPIELPQPPKPKEQPKPKIIEKQPDKAMSPYRSFNKVMLFCLPSKIEEIHDGFYNEKRTHIAYNSPFKFAATVVKFTDINYMVWTTVDKLSQYSIIYDGDARRWWKVGQVIADPSGDGLLVHCSISDLEPDFSSLG